MKEIGEKLKSARESIGVSIEEAAEDLKISASQITDIENGNVEHFQDVFNLKYFIRDYAKYLGLNKEEIVDDFNEYLFDYTSKLSLEDLASIIVRGGWPASISIKSDAKYRIAKEYVKSLIHEEVKSVDGV